MQEVLVGFLPQELPRKSMSVTGVVSSKSIEDLWSKRESHMLSII